MGGGGGDSPARHPGAYGRCAQGRPQDFFQGAIGDGRVQWLGGTMASAEHEPIMGVQGQSPWSGGQNLPEAESILVIGCPTEPANLAPASVFLL